MKSDMTKDQGFSLVLGRMDKLGILFLYFFFYILKLHAMSIKVLSGEA